MTGLILAGGWGYNNLGDEAILAGYLSHFRSRTELMVTSPDPGRTALAQGGDSFPLHKEGRLPKSVSKSATVLLCGGGYLNGGWQPEITLKTMRLLRDRGDRRLATHGVELRSLDRRPVSVLARRLFTDTPLAVRDTQSAAHASVLGLGEPPVVPDSISLIYPSLKSFITPLPQLRGRVLVNLLDISERSDSSEAEIDVASWRDFCVRLLRDLGSRAVGLVVGGGDYRFLKSLGPVSVLQPRTVVDLLSAINSAAGLMSVRMHPALLGSMLDTPTVSVPYCGKVRPTMERIGLESLILPELDLSLAHDMLSTRRSFDEAWRTAYNVNSQWLSDNLGS